MVFLINIIPFLILSAGILALLLVKGWKKKVSVILFTLGVNLIYMQVQPSYAPKGTVRSNPVVEFKQLDIPVVDRSLKPMSDAQRDIERKAAMEQIDQRIKMQIEMNKQIQKNKE